MDRWDEGSDTHLVPRSDISGDGWMDVLDGGWVVYLLLLLLLLLTRWMDGWMDGCGVGTLYSVRAAYV